MDKYSLERFADAQEKHYEKALNEMRNGRKWGHWIWYIFPQLRGLGQSSLSDYYGIEDIEEASGFLVHPVFGVHLREITNALLGNDGKTAADIFSDIDAVKVRSSMTLFDAVSPNDIFGRVLDKFYESSRDELTLRMLGLIPEIEKNVKPRKKGIIGAIIGDIVGSRFEWNNHKSTDFDLFANGCRFTDDTVMTIAVAEWLETGKHLPDIMRKWAKKYFRRGYGVRFANWLFMTPNPQPYNSLGNGSGMRVSPVGFFAISVDDACDLARRSAEVSHNHPEGIKGAQAIASAIFLAREGKSKEEIRDYIEQTFGYNLHRTCDEIRPTYQFNMTCEGSCPEAIVAFLDSTDYESAIRLAVSLGGDSDTIACMTGGIAAAFYGVPDHIIEQAMEYIPDDMMEIINKFDGYVFEF